MKVGLLTFHRADNYGALLQVYGLQEALKMMNYKVEIIDYRQNYIEKNYKLINIKKDSLYTFIKSIISSIVKYPLLKKKKEKFISFRMNHLDISNEKYTNSSEIKDYDAYITGSDQVWNLELTNYDATFFLDFVNADEKKISYAASIGKKQLTENEVSFFKRKISNIDNISVRENSAKEIIDSLSIRTAERVLDPTLLLHRDKWNSISGQKVIEGDYIFVYSVGDLGDILEISKKLSSILQKKVIFVGKSKINREYGFKKYNNVGVEDFLSLIKHSSFVITNSFHGTIFSIIYEKNFLTLPHKTTGARMIELLELLDLEDRIYGNVGLETILNKKINFLKIYSILEKERNKSLEFLCKSLSLDNKKIK